MRCFNLMKVITAHIGGLRYVHNPELYGDDPAAYGYPYGNGYNAGPYAYAGGYFQQVPTSSSICWEPIRGRVPCNAGP